MNFSRSACSAWCLFALLATVLAGCGGGGGGGSAAAPATLTANEHRVYVDNGPTGTGYNANRLFTDVTICQPGSAANCQTIDHVLVDTGSTGLRILSSQVSPSLGLRGVAAPGGLPLLGCAQFVDLTFAWGPVAQADIRLGAKLASSVPIQLMGDPAYAGPATNCMPGGTYISSAATLGANGILGIGLFKEDCGAFCVANASRFYFTCTSVVCNAVRTTAVPASQQMKNPVALFASDNNGVGIELPLAGNGPASGVAGLLVFGIGTQANNQASAGRLLTANSQGNFLTVAEGRSMPASFIDSGSNALFFDSLSLPRCNGASSFYCPAVLTAMGASLVGGNLVTVNVVFNIDNALSSFIGSNPVLPYLGGTFGNSQSFDWGLPFFFGRKVYFGIEGMASNVGTGPFYAF